LTAGSCLVIIITSTMPRPRSDVVPPEQVRRIRRDLDETQARFARRLGVDPVTVARWETGQRRCTGAYAQAVQALALAGSPRAEAGDATVSALAQLARTLFQGSTATAVSALLEHESLSDDDLDALARLIEAKKHERKKRADRPRASGRRKAKGGR
jgi:transcriptional regulator with XRE-family HTH domain